jgi:bifunctional non-homologous end joining protein LigD
MLPQIKPITPLRIKVPFDDPEFIAELKHDGFRAMAYIESGAARLISRKQIVYKSKPFVNLCSLLGQLPVKPGG